MTPKHRLFVKTTTLRAAQAVPLPASQAHYVLNVLRLEASTPLLIFNGQDGLWLAKIVCGAKKKDVSVMPLEKIKEQPAPSSLMYCFAPLKKARLDYMCQKAVEMGVGILQPVITERSCVRSVRSERLRGYVLEACMQCAQFSIPEIRPECTLKALLTHWEEKEADRQIIFCDEAAPFISPYQQLFSLKEREIALFVGPEGGFSEKERLSFMKKKGVHRICLGPRILRADTAAVAALALIQLVQEHLTP